MKQKQLIFIVILLSTLFIFTAAVVYAGKGPASSSDLPVKWGELTAPDFIKAVEKSAGLCLRFYKSRGKIRRPLPYSNRCLRKARTSFAAWNGFN